MHRTVVSVFIGLTVLLAACASVIDTTAPEVAISVRASDVVRSGDSVRVSVRDAESGIASVSIDFDGANLLFETFEADARPQQAVAFDVTIGKQLVLGETYRLDVTVVNGFGLTTERTVALVAAAADEAAAPVQTGPQLRWIAPAPGSPVPGVVELSARVVSTGTVASATFSIANEAGSVDVDAVDAGGGVYTYSWSARDFPAGDYVVTFAVRDADGAMGEVQVKLIVAQGPDAGPSVVFVAPSPTPGQRVAGLIDIGVAFDAPRGFASASLELVAEGLGGNSVDFTPDEAEGRLSARFNTLRVEPGDYALVATVRDETGDAATATLSFTVLSPFVITNPLEGSSVGLGEDRQRVSIVVGANGTIDDFVTITSADVFIDGEPLGTASIQDSGDNQIAVYSWDTVVTVVGVHDADASGDRVITVEVSYSYDAGDGVVSSSRFTPGVLVDFQP